MWLSKHKLSIKSRQCSLSVAGGLAGLASIPLYSAKTPVAMDESVGKHTWSDGVPLSSVVM